MLKDTSEYKHKDKIEQLDLEEAIALYKLGLPVRWDYTLTPWDDPGCSCSYVGEAYGDDIILMDERHTTYSGYILYLLK